MRDAGNFLSKKWGLSCQKKKRLNNWKSSAGIHFVNEMLKHYKPVAVANEAVDFLEVSMIGSAGPGRTNQETSSELGVVSVRNYIDLNSFSQEFVKAIAKHRHWDRMDKSSNTPA